MTKVKFAFSVLANFTPLFWSLYLVEAAGPFLDGDIFQLLAAVLGKSFPQFWVLLGEDARENEVAIWTD